MVEEEEDAEDQGDDPEEEDGERSLTPMNVIQGFQRKMHGLYVYLICMYT